MTHSRFTRIFAWITLVAFANSTAYAAVVDIANVPLVSMSTKLVRPNVYFILDDSSSMAYDFMPDDVNSNSSKPCFRNFGYNKVAYNPNVTYDLPKQANGNDVTYSPTITSARSNGYDSGSASVDLTDTTTNYTPSGSNVSLNNPATFKTTNNSRVVRVTKSNHGLNNGDTVRFTGTPTTGSLNNIPWTNITWQNDSSYPSRLFTITRIDPNTFEFTAAGTTNANNSNTVNGASGYTVRPVTVTTTGDYFYYTHATNPSTCAADNTYTRVDISTANAIEKANYAKWYSFYRTRLLMMKSAVGRAFVGVDDNYRVGFSTTSEKGTDESATNNRFLRIKTYNSAHKSDWYSRLYSAPGDIAGTPLRGSLSKAGRYYAGTLVTGNNDPVQYSCQKNFTILTTDGYWNKYTESTSAPRFGPYREDNSTLIGNQDADINTSPRPMFDAGTTAAYQNSLADVSRYYYRTDLRTSTALGGLRDDGSRTTVAANIKDNQGNDLPDGHQHMKTITLSLGLSGTLPFSSATLAQLTAGTRNWPSPRTDEDTTAGFAERLDDLWHAAVNGGGIHLSASDAEDVVDALRTALATISDRDRSGASAATSSLEPVAGDNYAYIAKYTTARWFGDIEARTIDVGTSTVPGTGAISPTAVWSAQALLDAAVLANSDTRDIYTWNSGGTARVDFKLANVNASNFNASLLSQYGGFNSTQRSSASAAALVNYLRGQHEFESRNDGTHTQIDKRLFRQRDHVLGDIIDSSPVYVKKPPFRYADSGYAAYVGAQTSRGGTVYVGANDGMLHAFDASTGAERWAYVPRMLHPELYKLADTNYANNHRYYVNGSITVGDAFNGTNWRTVLIAGLGSGGKGYFALDITDPEDPTVLWEYTNANLGYSHGNPVLTKRAADGTWVVLFASGYNNNAGDSQGRLFMVNAFTGANIGSIQTTTGANPDRSGIAKITNWVLDTLVDNTTQYVYGGDLAGNLWRFDINDLSLQKLGQTSSTAGARPITSRPEVARIRDAAGNYHRVVYVGTGRYLGGNDVAGGSAPETTQQVLLAVKDTGTDLGTLTDTTAKLVAQTLNTAVTPRTIPTPQPVNWVDGATSGNHNGWYVTIPLGERVTIEPRLQLGTVSFVANKPVDDYCALGGSSWLYALDYKSGGALSTQASNLVGFVVDEKTIGTGVTIVRLPDGRLVAIINTPEGTKTIFLPTEAAGAGTVRRVGYREIK